MLRFSLFGAGLQIILGGYLTWLLKQNLGDLECVFRHDSTQILIRVTRTFHFEIGVHSSRGPLCLSHAHTIGESVRRPISPALYTVPIDSYDSMRRPGGLSTTIESCARMPEQEQRSARGVYPVGQGISCSKRGVLRRTARNSSPLTYVTAKTYVQKNSQNLRRCTNIHAVSNFPWAAQ